MIHEYPYLAIDDFRTRDGWPHAEIGFLTHMHEDHTLGLQRKSFNGPYIYCTAATKQMVLNYRTNHGHGRLKYAHLKPEIGGKDLLRVLEPEKAYELEYQREIIEATLIPINHCPGSAMVLIKPKYLGSSILYTGDLRCEPVDLTTLQRTPSLFPFLTTFQGSKSLVIYVDATYLQHTDPLKSYPLNSDGVDSLGEVLKAYPKHMHFSTVDMCTGHEPVLIKLAYILKTKIHIDAYLYDYYKSVSGVSAMAAELVNHCVTGPCTQSARLHFCYKHNGCEAREPSQPTVYFRACNQPSKEGIEMQNRTVPSSQVRERLEAAGNGVYIANSMRYYLYKNLYFPLSLLYHFSRHASFPEIHTFVNLFNTTAVRTLEGNSINVETNATKRIKRLQTVQRSTLESDEERARFDAFKLCGKTLTKTSISSVKSFQVVNETPSITTNLELELRKNPSLWYTFGFDYPCH